MSKESRLNRLVKARAAVDRNSPREAERAVWEKLNTEVVKAADALGKSVSDRGVRKLMALLITSTVAYLAGQLVRQWPEQSDGLVVVGTIVALFATAGMLLPLGVLLAAMLPGREWWIGQRKAIWQRVRRWFPTREPEAPTGAMSDATREEGHTSK